MTIHEEYLWERLVQALRRNATPSQRLDLAACIRLRTNDWALLDAAEKLVQNSLRIEDAEAGWAKGTRALNIAEYRKGLNGTPVAKQPVVFVEEIAEVTPSLWQKIRTFILGN